MKISKGIIKKPALVLIYSPDGVGKSTFASEAPAPIFVGPEDGSSNLDVERFEGLSTFEDVKKAILQFVNGSVDWRAILRNFIGNAQRANRSNTIKRINKRFPYIHPGRKTNHSAHIAIAIDQSGSVSDEMLSMFFAELSGLSKLVTFTVVPFDTEVGEKLVYEWKKGQKHKVERVMQGGTDFNAPTEWVNKHPEIDGLIVLSDMQAPSPVPCRVRRLWMTDEYGKNSPYFQTNELVVEIKNNKRS